MIWDNFGKFVEMFSNRIETAEIWLTNVFWIMKQKTSPDMAKLVCMKLAKQYQIDILANLKSW